MKPVSTNHRTIKTTIPHPDDLELIEKISKYEKSALSSQLPLVWDKAEGSYIYDRFGNKFIDLSSSIFVTNSGHANKKSLKAIKETLDKPLLHAYCYPTSERLKLLELLDEMTPKYLNAFRLTSTGSEASEVALRTARLWGRAQSPDKNVIIGGHRNFHGKTMGAFMSATTPEAQEWIGATDPNMIQMPFPYPWVLEEEKIDGESLFHQHIQEQIDNGLNPQNVAAFIIEAYQGWGCIFYPESYVQAMKSWCEKNNSLLIVDEIQSGFGRSGRLFCFEHYGIEPDMVTCGKAISGSLPLSAVLGRKEVMDIDPSHSSTHGGHPLSCAAAIGNLESFKSEKLVERSHELGPKVEKLIEKWKAKFPHRIGRVLGKGLVWGIFINKPDSDELDAEYTDQLIQKALQKGVYSIRTGCGTIKLGPPLNISEEALEEAFDVYIESMTELEK